MRLTFHRCRIAALTLAAALLVGAFASAARAALVTTNEATLDAIFSQPSFGATPVDIAFNPIHTIYNPDWLIIDNDAELDQMFGPPPLFASPVINLFFVDEIIWCGESNPNIVGCAGVNYNVNVVESDFAAGFYGAELLGHEIGHNLGLTHTTGGLMNAYLNTETDLTTDQVTTIIGSPLIQYYETGDRFIEITPILITAHTPLPPAAVMFLTGFAAATGLRWRRARAAKRQLLQVGN